MSGKPVKTINEVQICHSGACWNPVEPWQLLTLFIVESKYLDTCFCRSDTWQLNRVQARYASHSEVA